jgi:thioesterase domain-containing protein
VSKDFVGSKVRSAGQVVIGKVFARALASVGSKDLGGGTQFSKNRENGLTRMTNLRADPASHFADPEQEAQHTAIQTEGQHLATIRASGIRPPLFCVFPGPPGGREFVDLLPEDQPVYDFYFTKLDGASNFPTVEQLAETFIQELRGVRAHGPYQLCGYSKAGLVAYEIARLLLSEGEDVPFLVLFETWHPGYEQHLTPGELVGFRTLQIVDRFKKYGQNLIRGRLKNVAATAYKGIVKRAKLIGWRITRSIFSRSHRAVPQGMQHVESIVVLKSFVPKAYPKRFMLIRTDDPFERKLSDQTFGWHVCATKGVDVHFVPGDQDHGTMMDKPHVRGVMDKIIPYLAGPQRQ